MKLCLPSASGVTSFDGVDTVALNELAPHQPSPPLRPYDDPLPLKVNLKRLDIYKCEHRLSRDVFSLSLLLVYYSLLVSAAKSPPVSLGGRIGG